MIISASRRTDIPAFYSKWFFNRIRAGYLLVRNPINIHQISKVSLEPEKIDCIVFWTKNPRPMLKRLGEIENYKYYFQFTLTSYSRTLETNVIKKSYLIKTFKELSNKIGKEKVIWRYDPIILTDIFTKQYHYKCFEYLADKLYKYTDECVISFLDLYKKTERNMKNINVKQLEKEDMREIAYNLSNIATKYNLKMKSCSEGIDLEGYNIEHGKCIDDKLISKVIDCNLNVEKDPNQREVCGCVKSIDIGEYNTCKHGCLYCYANFNKERVKKQVGLHDNKSALLIGTLGVKDNVTERRITSFKCNQIQENFLNNT
ncbi:DUF1848 domain-containing protein [Clostridium sp. LBM24168]